MGRRMPGNDELVQRGTLLCPPSLARPLRSECPVRCSFEAHAAVAHPVLNVSFLTI
jgi:hypothetical protein